MSLRAYVSAERGRCRALADAIKVHPVLVSQWSSGKRGVPVEHCAAIERATERAVARWHLRPSDWHLIWPELIGADGAPPVPSEVRDAA